MRVWTDNSFCSLVCTWPSYGKRMGNHSSDPYKVHFDGDVSTILPRHLRDSDDKREG